MHRFYEARSDPYQILLSACVSGTPAVPSAYVRVAVRLASRSRDLVASLRRPSTRRCLRRCCGFALCGELDDHSLHAHHGVLVRTFCPSIHLPYGGTLEPGWRSAFRGQLLATRVTQLVVFYLCKSLGSMLHAKLRLSERYQSDTGCALEEQ
jgi:hypothetical protein